MLTRLSACKDGHSLASLDALRGLAILLVLIAHFLPADAPYFREINLSGANLGVILFFFLSGFLMDRTFAADARLFSYAIRRSFRILPMYWLSIALIFTLDSGWSVRDAIVNATFTTQIAHVTRMSGVYWTLYIEVLFYTLVPVLWWLGSRAIYCAPFAVISTFVVAWMAGLPLSDASFYLVYCFAGMLFGRWHRKQISDAALLISMIAVIAGSSALPIVSPFLGLAPLISATLLYAALRFPFRFTPLEFAGDVSYSCYLLHQIFGQMATRLLLAAGWNEWLAAFLGITAALALSIATFYWIEVPAINIGRRLIRRRTFAPRILSETVL